VISVSHLDLFINDSALVNNAFEDICRKRSKANLRQCLQGRTSTMKTSVRIVGV
jgi:hypothetical protein